MRSQGLGGWGGEENALFSVRSGCWAAHSETGNRKPETVHLAWGPGVSFLPERQARRLARALFASVWRVRTVPRPALPLPLPPTPAHRHQRASGRSCFQTGCRKFQGARGTGSRALRTRLGTSTPCPSLALGP